MGEILPVGYPSPLLLFTASLRAPQPDAGAAVLVYKLNASHLKRPLVNRSVGRLAVATHYNDDGQEPDAILAHTPPEKNFDDQSFAHLVKGILDVAGLRSDQYGRLLS